MPSLDQVKNPSGSANGNIKALGQDVKLAFDRNTPTESMLGERRSRQVPLELIDFLRNLIHKLAVGRQNDRMRTMGLLFLWSPGMVLKCGLN